MPNFKNIDSTTFINPEIICDGSCIILINIFMYFHHIHFRISFVNFADIEYHLQE